MKQWQTLLFQSHQADYIVIYDAFCLVKSIHIYYHSFPYRYLQLLYSWIQMSRTLPFLIQVSYSLKEYSSKSDLENPRSKLWVCSNVNIIQYIQHLIDSYPFRSMPIGPHIPKMQLFNEFTLKIQGQGHEWGQKSMPYSGSTPYQFISLLCPCQLDHIFLRFGLTSRGAQNMIS